MDALSTSASSINVPKLHPRTHCFYHLKPPLLLSNHLVSAPTTATSAAAGKGPSSIITKPSASSHHKFTPTSQRPSTSQPTPSPVHNNRNAATGYAAALIDAGLCSNSLNAFHDDVKRLLKWLTHNEMLRDMMRDPSVEEGVKGRAIKELSEKAKLRRQVVAIVKMLVAKNKSGMVAQIEKTLADCTICMQCVLRLRLQLELN